MTKSLEALIAKIKTQTESFDTVVLKEDEAKALIAALEQKDKCITGLESRQLSVKLPSNAHIHSNWSAEYLLKSDVVEAIRAAGGIVEGGK